MGSHIGRREVLVAGAATSLLAALPPRVFAQQKTLVVATFPGTWSEADRNLLAPYFKKRTGASVTQSIQLATEQLAKLAAAKGGRDRFDRLDTGKLLHHPIGRVALDELSEAI